MSEDDDREAIDALRRLRFRTTAILDARVLRDATAALRATRRRRLLPRAVAALLTIGAAAGVVAYLARPAITLADVQRAFVAQRWMHVAFDDGRQEWTDLADGTRYEQDLNGSLGAIYITQSDGVRWSWHRGGSIAARDHWYVGPGVPPRRSPLDEWRRLFGADDRATTRPSAAVLATLPRDAIVHSATRADDAFDGLAVVRFDDYATDTLGQTWLANQTWVDPTTRLPIATRVPRSPDERRRTGRETIVGRYAFPTTGPASLADLGAPASLAVIDADARATTRPAVASIFARAEAAAARFPTRRRVVVWPMESPTAAIGNVDVEYRDGDRSSRGRWFVTDDIGGPRFPLGTTSTDAVVAWTATRAAVERHVGDGSRSYDRHDPQPHFVNESPRATVRVQPFYPARDDPNYPPGGQWSYAQGDPIEYEIATDVADAPADLVVLRQTFGDERRDYWIDPARDSACTREIWSNRSAGEWKIDRQWRRGDWRRLPTGDWYAGRREFGDATAVQEASRIEVRIVDAFPPGTFDGAAMLKDADVSPR